jgi:hypothetical protein
VIKFKLLFVVSLFFVEVTFQQELFAQQENKKEKKRENVFLHPKKFYKKYFPKLRINQNPPDSLYIKMYPTFLSASVHVLVPSIRLGISPGSANTAGASKFRTSIGDIAGFNMSYKFVSAGFSFLLNTNGQSNNDFVKSEYRTATIKYAGSAWSLQYKFLKFKGLTDVNPDNNTDPTHRYSRRPDITNKEFQFEAVCNPGWKKYSYIAPFEFSQRQLKSRIGLLFKTGIYYTQLFGDSALIAPKQQLYYDDFNNVRAIRTLSIKLAPGIGGNVIFFKRYYFCFMIFSSYDLSFYKYLARLDEKVKSKQAFVFDLDGMASLGFQTKRFYGGLRYEVERKGARLYSIRTRNVYTYLGVALGYRFNAPRFVKKVYKATMPPGM